MATIALQPYSLSRQLGFSGHETFVLRYGWLKKAYDAVVADPGMFTRDDAVVTLGVGKNMVRSIRHWSLACEVLREEPKTRGLRLVPTAFGNFLFGDGGRDQYLEDTNSLWLIHWHLCTNESRATTWNWAFNVLRATEFSRPALIASIQSEIARKMLKAPLPSTLKRDVDVFVRTYLPSRVMKKNVLEDSLDCPLVELGLLVTEDEETVSFVRGSHRSLHDNIFAACLVDFWNRDAPKQETLSFNEIAYAPNSPGCVFKLDEESLVERLENLEQICHGRILFGDTAGVKQIYRKAAVAPEELLEHYYLAAVKG